MKVREIIRRLKEERQDRLFSSHELGEVETICDRVAILHQGETEGEGRVDHLPGPLPMQPGASVPESLEYTKPEP